MLKKIIKKSHCYIWIAPFFILFIIFTLYPTINGFYLSLTKWDGFTPNPTWVGLDNYRNMVHDSVFWQTLFNTVIIWVFIVPVRLILSLALASIINAPKIKGKGTYAFFLFLPNVTAVVTVAVVFRIIFATNGGIINSTLGMLGVEPLRWLDSKELSKFSISIMQTWRATGYFTIIMLAGLQRIDKSIYEAAEIDGASPFAKFFRITTPLMKDVIFYVAIISTIWVFQNVGVSMILTSGGPGYSSTNLILYIYNNAFRYSKLGYASAMSYVLFLILFVVSIISIKLNSKNNAKSGGMM